MAQNSNKPPLSEAQTKAFAQALRALATAYEKSSSWVASQLSLWSESAGLRRVDPDRLVEVVYAWIDTETRPPMLAQLVAKCGGGAESRGEARTPQGMPAALVGGQVCADCQGNGWVEVAIHRGADVHVAALKCVCRGGEDPRVSRERWLRQEPTIDRIYLGLGRALTYAERGICKPEGKVIPLHLRYTPNPEALDTHRAERTRRLAEAAKANEVGMPWDDNQEEEWH